MINKDFLDYHHCSTPESAILKWKTSKITEVA